MLLFPSQELRDNLEAMDLSELKQKVRQRRFGALVAYKYHHFIKTGSGRTEGKHSKRERGLFFIGDAAAADPVADNRPGGDPTRLAGGAPPRHEQRVEAAGGRGVQQPPQAAAVEGCVNILFGMPFHILKKRIILARQARDKHRESTQKRDARSGDDPAGCGGSARGGQVTGRGERESFPVSCLSVPSLSLQSAVFFHL